MTAVTSADVWEMPPSGVSANSPSDEFNAALIELLHESTRWSFTEPGRAPCPGETGNLPSNWEILCGPGLNSERCPLHTPWQPQPPRPVCSAGPGTPECTSLAVGAGLYLLRHPGGGWLGAHHWQETPDGAARSASRANTFTHITLLGTSLTDAIRRLTSERRAPGGSRGRITQPFDDLLPCLRQVFVEACAADSDAEQAEAMTVALGGVPTVDPVALRRVAGW